MAMDNHEDIAVLDAHSSDKFYIRSFLIDDSINANGWGVSREAIMRSITTAIGKPFIVDFERFGHPSASTPEELLRVQERYRVGTIIDVGYSNGKAWFIAEIDDARAIKAIRDGLVRFVSPSIIVDEQNIRVDANGNEIADMFIVAHVAGVRDPAFGVVKAQIKGICSGSRDTCMYNLRLVNASADRLCVRECLHDKKVKGLEVDDKAIAICLNECRDENGKNNSRSSSSLCSSYTNVNSMHAQDIIADRGNGTDTNNDKIAEYEKIIKELRDRLRVAETKPIINRIINAKLRLGRIRESDVESEMARYANSCMDLLEELASVYEELSSMTSRGAIAMRKSYSSSSIALSANRSTVAATPNTNDTTLYADALLMMV